MTVTRKEALEFLRNHYGLTMSECMRLVNTQDITHPHDMRDEFAKVALQGILSTSHGPYFFKDPYVEPIIAENAYRIADAMLAERIK